jgi:hypothetical protein
MIKGIYEYLSPIKCALLDKKTKRNYIRSLEMALLILIWQHLSYKKGSSIFIEADNYKRGKRTDKTGRCLVEFCYSGKLGAEYFDAVIV